MDGSSSICHVFSAFNIVDPLAMVCSDKQRPGQGSIAVGTEGNGRRARRPNPRTDGGGGARQEEPGLIGYTSYCIEITASQQNNRLISQNLRKKTLTKTQIYRKRIVPIKIHSFMLNERLAKFENL